MGIILKLNFRLVRRLRLQHNAPPWQWHGTSKWTELNGEIDRWTNRPTDRQKAIVEWSYRLPKTSSAGVHRDFENLNDFTLACLMEKNVCALAWLMVVRIPNNVSSGPESYLWFKNTVDAGRGSFVPCDMNTFSKHWFNDIDFIGGAFLSILYVSTSQTHGWQSSWYTIIIIFGGIVIIVLFMTDTLTMPRCI